MKTAARSIIILVLMAFMVGCRSHPPIATVPSVDLERFMGDWYVIASIPTSFEKGAYNALENYRLETNGTVATTFTFKKGAFDGPLKTYTSRAYIRDDSGNAHWGMQFIWPFKAEYRIIFLNQDYTQTVIGRSKRDYVWVMARTPTIPEADFARILDLLTTVGYDTARLQNVPQQPLDQR